MKIQTIIQPAQPFWKIDFQELWNYRELFQTFAWRDIKVKYKQTVVGVLWAIMQPLIQMIVFSFFFGKLASIPSDNVPYPLFSFSGLVLWTMFTTALSTSSNSMLTSSSLISKVYFPRIVVPVASSLVSYVDYIVAWFILIALFIFFRYPPAWTIIISPLIGILVLFLANGIGFFLAAINVKFRDVRYALPFFIQLLVFVSPVIYPVSVAGRFEWLVNLNPMSGYLELHRSLILGHQTININATAYSLLFTILIFTSGLMFFNWQQRKFVDII